MSNVTLFFTFQKKLLPRKIFCHRIKNCCIFAKRNSNVLNFSQMTKAQKQFFLYAAILLAIALGVSQLLFSAFFVTFSFPARIISIVLVWGATCLSHWWVMKTVTDRPKAFARVFMAQTALKFLLYMAFIAGYLFFFRQHGVPFIVHFFVVYLIFAVFDVALTLRFVSKNAGQEAGSIKKTN